MSAFADIEPPATTKVLLGEERVIEDRDGKKVELLVRRYRIRKPFADQWKGAHDRQTKEWKFESEKLARVQKEDGLVEVAKPAQIQYSHLSTANLGLEAQAAKAVQNLQQRVALKQVQGPSTTAPGLFQAATTVDRIGSPDSQDWRARGEAAPAPGVWRPTSVSGPTDDTSRTLKVSNLASTTQQNALRDYLTDRYGSGNITRLHLRNGASDRDSSHTRGFAFVTFSSRQLAQIALKELTERPPSMDHRVLSFDWARSPGERGP